MFCRSYCPLRFRALVGLLINKFNVPLKNAPDLVKLGAKSKNNGQLLLLTGVALQLCNTEGISDDEFKKAIDEFKVVSGTDHKEELRKELEADDWELVILKDTFEIWRRPTRIPGIYQYKGRQPTSFCGLLILSLLSVWFLWRHISPGVFHRTKRFRI